MPQPDDFQCPACQKLFVTLKALLMHRAASACGANPLTPLKFTKDDERFLRSLHITPKEAVNE